MPEDLCFLYGTFLGDYLHDMEICQRFARKNRELMAGILLERAGLEGLGAFHTVHNYIDTRERILRNGAIAAHKGEKVLIPINMRDGSVLAVGKGNLHEAPMAYKSLEDIIDIITESVDVIEVLKPIYNFKAN